MDYSVTFQCVYGKGERKDIHNTGKIVRCQAKLLLI